MLRLDYSCLSPNTYLKRVQQSVTLDRICDTENRQMDEIVSIISKTQNCCISEMSMFVFLTYKIRETYFFSMKGVSV